MFTPTMFEVTLDSYTHNKLKLYNHNTSSDSTSIANLSRLIHGKVTYLYFDTYVCVFKS